jgi:hypothetical protein
MCAVQNPHEVRRLVDNDREENKAPNQGRGKRGQSRVRRAALSKYHHLRSTAASFAISDSKKIMVRLFAMTNLRQAILVGRLTNPRGTAERSAAKPRGPASPLLMPCRHARRSSRPAPCSAGPCAPAEAKLEAHLTGFGLTARLFLAPTRSGSRAVREIEMSIDFGHGIKTRYVLV